MFKKILIPVDLDMPESWRTTLPIAEAFARDHGAEVHALAVVPGYSMSLVGSFFPAGYEAQVVEKTAKLLAKTVKDNGSGDSEIKTHVASGNIYEEILRFAGDNEFDLIVIASHRPELKDYLIGPNAARVVRHAKISVFVVRE